MNMIPSHHGMKVFLGPFEGKKSTILRRRSAVREGGRTGIKDGAWFVHSKYLSAQWLSRLNKAMYPNRSGIMTEYRVHKPKASMPPTKNRKHDSARKSHGNIEKLSRQQQKSTPSRKSGVEARVAGSRRRPRFS